MTGNSATGLALKILVGLTVLFLVVPVVIIVPVSFTSGAALEFPPAGFSSRWYDLLVSDAQLRAALIQSIVVAAGTVIASLVLGVSAAVALQRTRLRGRKVIYWLAIAPLVTPVVVLAIGDFMVFSRWQITGTTLGLVIAHTVLAVPLVIVSVTASLHTISPNLADASASLGAGPIRTFWRVTIPLLRPGIAAGGVFAFITSWDEVVTSIFLSSPSNRTLPVLIWNEIRTNLTPTIAAVGTVLIAVSIMALIVVQRMQSRTDRQRELLEAKP